MTKTMCAVAALGMLAVAGCDTVRQTNDVEQSGFLLPSVYQQLAPTGDRERAALGYINPNFDVTKYDKMLLDPIVSFNDPDAEGNLDAEDSQALANNFYAALLEEFSKDYEMVAQPGPNTLRMKIAIIKATEKNVALDTISTIVPVGFVASSLAAYVTEKPLFNGELKIEFEVRDSVTRNLFGAGIDSRAGGKGLTQDQFSGWSDVNAAFKIYAQGMRYRLCLQRGDSDCQAPQF